LLFPRARIEGISISESPRAPALISKIFKLFLSPFYSLQNGAGRLPAPEKKESLQVWPQAFIPLDKKCRDINIRETIFIGDKFHGQLV
jgi:hypothetical protein